MPFKPHGEGSPGHFKGLFDPEGRFVSEGKMDRPAGLHIGHRQGVAKLTGRIAAVVLDQVDLEKARRSLCIVKPGNDRDGPVEEADRLGAASGLCRM